MKINHICLASKGDADVIINALDVKAMPELIITAYHINANNQQNVG